MRILREAEKTKFKFIFIVSRNISEVFNVTIFADDEKMARAKLRKVVEGDFKAKIHSVEERE